MTLPLFAVTLKSFVKSLVLLLVIGSFVLKSPHAL
jgi:hypothetical protein